MDGSGWKVGAATDEAVAIAEWGGGKSFTANALFTATGLVGPEVNFPPTYKRAKYGACHHLAGVTQPGAGVGREVELTYTVRLKEKKAKLYCLPLGGDEPKSAQQLCELGRCLVVKKGKSGYENKHMPAHTDRILVSSATVETEEYKAVSLAGSPS